MIIDGRALARSIQDQLTFDIEKMQGRKPCLAVLLVGNYLPSKIYVNRKTAACHKVGIIPLQKEFPASFSEQALLKEIDHLNQDPLVDGILVQLPLPSHIDPFKVSLAIDPKKDVDGFHPLNIGKLLLGEMDGFVSCTPLGIQELLLQVTPSLQGKHVVIAGRSHIVGKPLAALLMQKNARGGATVTVAHSQTKRLKEMCQMADILVTAIGKPHFFGPDYIHKDLIVIDVGINQIEDVKSKKGYKIVGDVDFEKALPLCKAISPVPGGVGPMTIAMLLKNTLKAF